VVQAKKGQTIPPMTYVPMIKVTSGNVGEWPTDKQ
jgi:hypothetical protein